MNTRTPPILRKILIVAVCAAGVFGLIFLVRFVLQQFQIRDIFVSGDTAIVEVNAKQFVGNTLLFPAPSVIRQIKEDNPLVKSIEIKKHFPSTLELVVHKRQPIARLQTKTATVGIDEDAVITDEVGDVNKPIIQIDVPLVRMGQTIQDAAVQQGAKVITGTASFLAIQQITVYDTSSIRVKVQESNIFIPQKDDIRPILDTLQTLMSGFRIKGLIPKTIDLRFDKPVVQF